MANLSGDDSMFLDAKATSRRISAMIKKSGLTDKQIGEVMNLSSQAVNKWRNCKCLPDIENLYTLSRILDVSVEEFLVSKEESRPRWSYQGMDYDIPSTAEFRKRMLAYYVRMQKGFSETCS